MVGGMVSMLACSSLVHCIKHAEVHLVEIVHVLHKVLPTLQGALSRQEVGGGGRGQAFRDERETSREKSM